MRTINSSVVVIFVMMLFIGCASFPTATNTILMEGQFSVHKVGIMEQAIEAARSMDFPPMTKFDKDNGIVEFGKFGGHALGLTAQVRIRSDNNVDVTVKRGSIYGSLPVKETTDEFTRRLKEQLQAND